MAEIVFLSIGSNIGTREAYLESALASLRELLIGFRHAQIYETLPRGITDQPRFLNTAACGRTGLDPFALLEEIQSLERRLGRDREQATPGGARTMDIDIILYGERVIHTDQLHVPHPRAKDRKFVLVPLLELDVSLVNPETSIPYLEYMKNLEPQGIYYSTLNRYNEVFGRRKNGNRIEHGGSAV